MDEKPVYTHEIEYDFDDRGSLISNECNGCTYSSHMMYEYPCINCTDGSEFTDINA